MTKDQLTELREWIECENCGASGFSGHDCGEDSCCCLRPEENDECTICRGEGGWFENERPK